MPAITLRITDDEHNALKAAALAKNVSMSELVRRYAAEGIREDVVAIGDIQAEVDRRIHVRTLELQELAQVLEEATQKAAEPEQRSSRRQRRH